jgi:hypothetical protein
MILLANCFTDRRKLPMLPASTHSDDATERDDAFLTQKVEGSPASFRETLRIQDTTYVNVRDAIDVRNAKRLDYRIDIYIASLSLWSRRRSMLCGWLWATLWRRPRRADLIQRRLTLRRRSAGGDDRWPMMLNFNRGSLSYGQQVRCVNV